MLGCLLGCRGHCSKEARCNQAVCLADYVYEESLTKVGGSSADDALKALDKADDIFAMALRDEPNLDFKISRLRARLKLKYGACLLLAAGGSLRAGMRGGVCMARVLARVFCRGRICRALRRTCWEGGRGRVGCRGVLTLARWGRSHLRDGSAAAK